VVSLCLAVTSILVDALLDPRIGLVLAALCYIVTMPTLGSFTGGRPFLAACLVLYPRNRVYPPRVRHRDRLPRAGSRLPLLQRIAADATAPSAHSLGKREERCSVRS